MKKRILVVGYFGFVSDQLDGQTIKTRNLYQLLEKNNENDYSLEYFDTQSFRQSFHAVFIFLYKIFKCNILVYVPAHNSLRYIFPILYILSKVTMFRILYFAVGGWLDEYLSKMKLQTIFLRNVEAIFTESNEQRRLLISRYNFRNVTTFLNFRIHSFQPKISMHGRKLSIVYMARINKMKGIGTMFKLAEYINQADSLFSSIVIDFYGPVDTNDKDYFFGHIKRLNNVSYKGLLQPNDIYPTLNKYDLLVLPTQYYTEGFPGSILDAYISGIPVIVTNWKYAKEFVQHNVSGFLIPFENGENDLIHHITKLYKDPELLLKMKYNAYHKSKSFSSENAWEIIKDYIIS